ncbi:hypothetical protein MBLNU230_g6060t1 [Neophaeotheca triangularis]
MSASLLTPPLSTSPSTTISVSQQAPSFLSSQTQWSLPWPLSLLSNNESQEKWASYENLFLACIQTGDLPSASRCLEALTARFGERNERILVLTGMSKEAHAHTDEDLKAVMSWYEEILKEEAGIFGIRKRRIALLRSMGKTSDAVNGLVTLLDTTPNDAECWAELSDLYLTQGLYEQAIYCLEEVLLIMPNAWNMHARLGEVVYLSAGTATGGDLLKALSESMRRFCRSVELCDDYLRGYYGLKLTTARLIEAIPNASNQKPQKSSSEAGAGDQAPPTLDSVKKLNEVSTSKLAEIVRRSNAGEKAWDGYSQAELIAARELLDRDTQKIER